MNGCVICILIFAKLCQGDGLKQNKMSDSSSTHGRFGKYRLLRSFVPKMKSPLHSAQVGMRGRRILKVWRLMSTIVVVPHR